jgi:hypothetical protein
MRLFLPLLGAGIGAATADCRTRVVNDENCDFGESLVGFGVGMAAAAVLDSALLAWERAEPAPPSAPTPRTAAASSRLLSLSPVPVRGGGGLVIGGVF